jgi:uncharacterized protein involved in type VI secretion and phage assembly
MPTHVSQPVPIPRYGKYRGTVLNNIDPLQQGRILAQVPDVIAHTPTAWALPSTPWPAAGTLPLTVPPIGAFVWIEFEAGNVDYPIWSGCFWTAGNPPLLKLPGDETPLDL